MRVLCNNNNNNNTKGKKDKKNLKEKKKNNNNNNKQQAHGTAWPSNSFRRLADASQPSLKMPGKQCFCSSACPWPFNSGTRSPSETECSPNESPFQPLTLFFNIYAHRL